MTRRIVGSPVTQPQDGPHVCSRRRAFYDSLNPQVVDVAIDCQAAVNLLYSLVAHPAHRYVETAPALAASSFGALVPKIIGYRQVSDATLLHLARVCDLKLTTFDRPVAAVCPWDDNLELLTP